MGEATIYVSLIGGCTINGTDGRAIPIKARKARAILGVLAVSPGMVLPRDRLAGLFWSDFPEEKARSSLRQCVKILRDELGGAADVMLSDRELLGLNRASIRCDLAELNEFIDSARFGEPVFRTEMLHEQFFDGLAGLDEGFSVWLSVFREQLRRRLTARLEQVLFASVADEAAVAAAALSRLDPSHEPAVRHLMRHEAAAGNTLEAQRLFRSFRQRLEDDYGASPEEETVRLHREIGQSRARATTMQDNEISPPPANFKSRLPVLGFRGNGDAGFEERAIVTELVAALARFRTFSLRSIAKGTGSQTIACDYHVELAFGSGGVDGLIHVDLIDTIGGSIIWSYRVPAAGTAANWRETLVRGICGALDVYISENQIRQLRLKDPGSHTLTEKWMRGRQLLELWQPESDTEAERLFLEAIHLAPDHAPLHAGLADIYNVRHIVFPGIWRNPALEDKAMRLARRAVSLDPLEPASHVTLGWSLAMAGKASQATYSFLHGHELNPADPSLAMSAAHGLAICGELDQAVTMSRAAFAAHPAPPWLFWGFEANIRFLAGDYSGAMASVDRSGEIKANFLGWKCAAAGYAGHREVEAIAQEFVGRTAERWTGSKAPTVRNVTDWFLHIFPFGREQERQKLKEGLRLAGLPVE